MDQGDSHQDFEKKTFEELPAFEKKSPRMALGVKAMVWDRRSHGLFDYESRQVNRSQFSFKQSGMIVRTGDNISFAK